MAFCECCVKSIVGSITHLKRHGCSECHLKKYKAPQTTPKISQALIKDNKCISHEKNVFAAELKMTMFLHEPKFVHSICPDSPLAKDIKCSRTKATALTNTCLAKESIEVFQKQLNESGGFYSVIIDERTDISTKIISCSCYTFLP